MLITNAVLVNPGHQTEILPADALLIRGDSIAELGASDALLAAHPHEEVLDAHRALVVPGLICAHTHFYGAFARGMALPGEPAGNFAEILERLWWRLDKLLRPDDIAASALGFLCNAVRNGTTTLIDHHASPNAIAGSLDVIAEACGQAGVRACLCYEVTDRDGPEKARAGLRENERFIRRAARGSTAARGALAGMMGLHASMTLSDETLQAAAGSARDLGVGCHVHVAEDLADQEDSLRRHGQRVVDRLARAGALGPQSIAAHCVHVNPSEIALLASTGTQVVHNPRSNMNNAVGTAPLPALLAAGIPVGLGNDGFSMDMFQEMKAAYLTHKQATGDPRTLGADQVLEMAWPNNTWIAQAAFAGVTDPEGGRIAAGQPADLVFLDYMAPTPVTAGNLPWHVIFGVEGGMADTVIVAGRLLMRHRELLTLDEERIYARSRELASQLWARV
jgi:putative selenium metabolism protein SsnA